MIEKSVVSFPLCWVAEDVNAAPILPFKAPRAQSPSDLVEKARHL